MYVVLLLFLHVSYGHIMYTLQLTSKVLSQCFFHDISVKSNCHTHTAALLLPLSYIISNLFPYYLFFKHKMNYSTHTHTHTHKHTHTHTCACAHMHRNHCSLLHTLLLSTHDMLHSKYIVFYLFTHFPVSTTYSLPFLPWLWLLQQITLKFTYLQIMPNICNANWRSSSVVAICADYQQRKL